MVCLMKKKISIIIGKNAKVNSMEYLAIKYIAIDKIKFIKTIL